MSKAELTDTKRTESKEEKKRTPAAPLLLPKMTTDVVLWSDATYPEGSLEYYSSIAKPVWAADSNIIKYRVLLSNCVRSKYGCANKALAGTNQCLDCYKKINGKWPCVRHIQCFEVGVSTEQSYCTRHRTAFNQCITRDCDSPSLTPLGRCYPCSAQLLALGSTTAATAWAYRLNRSSF